MSGEEDIAVLLASLLPALDASVYTFATVSDVELERLDCPLGLFRESEGVSVICLLNEAQALGLKHEGEFKKISFTVHSSLNAVGLIARVATVLADRGIPCNVVAGFFHDHVFVPTTKAEEAMAMLAELR